MSQARTLKYGDVIRIHGMSKGSLSRGVLLSKGFTDPNIYYQTYTDFSEVDCHRETLFMIIPKTSFHINDELLKDSLSPKQREAIKLRAESQVSALDRNLNNRKGTEVLYGAQVLFKHIQSGAYLRGVLEAAESGEGSFKLDLIDQLSSYLGFKIRSHRSYERDGDKVYLDDPLQIYHNSSDCYVNFNQNYDKIFLDKQFPKQEYERGDEAYGYVTIHPNIKIPSLARTNVVNQNKSKCLWKFVLYEDYDNSLDVSTIKPHDIVYFEHTNRSGMITSSLIRPETTIKENNQRKQDITFYDSLWEMVPFQSNQTGPDKVGSYYIKNIITGKYLCYNSEEGAILANGQLGDQLAYVQPMDSQKEGNLMNRDLVNVVVNKSKIDKGDLIPLDDTLPFIEKSYMQPIDRFHLKLISQISEHSFIITKPEKKVLQSVMFVLSAQECLSKFCLLLQVREQDLTYNYDNLMGQCTDGILDLVGNTIKALIGKIFECSYSEINNAGKTPSREVQKIMVETGLTDIIIEIVYFMGIHSKFIISQSPDYRSERSKLSNIFEDSYRLLEKIVINCDENRIYISRWVELIMGHSYRINKSCIQQCLVGILENNAISIEATITQEKIRDLVQMFKAEALESYPKTKYLRLLSAFIKCSDRIIRPNQERVLRLFFQDETNKYRFKFRVNYKAAMADDNLENDSELSKLVHSREVQISYGGRDFVSFTQFFRNELTIWNYLLEYVNLMADVCMERNSNSIEAISSLLPLQLVLVILSDPNIALVNDEINKQNSNRLKNNLPPSFQNVYEPFIRIAHHVYINIKKFSPIRRISKIKYWQNMNPDEDIPKTKRVFQGQKEEEEKKYLGMILQFIRVYLDKCQLNPNNITEMKALYTTLDLLRITVTLGLWNTVKQFKDLLKALFMKIIKFDNSYIFQNGMEVHMDKGVIDKTGLKAVMNDNKANIKMVKPQMTLAIDCKNKAAEIFSLMIEMETNIRVTNLVLFFKNIYEANEKFEDYLKDYEQSPEMPDEAKKRDDIAKQAFFQSDQEGLLVKQKSKTVQHKQIILNERIWLNKLKELTPTQPENQMGECKRYFFEKIQNFDQIVMALLEVSEHQDFKMLNSSMLLLRKIFNQREDLINNFNNVVLCSKGNFYEITTKIREMKYKFNMLRDPEILNYNEENAKSFPFSIWKVYDQTTKLELQRSGIIQDMYFLSRVLKQNANLKNTETLMTVDESLFDRGKLLQTITEKEMNDRLFQTMALVQEVHVPIFDYIKMVKEEPATEDHYRLLCSIYNYLTLLVFNNIENKQHMMQYIRLVLPHLEYRVGTPQFIYHVCYNNKLLINDEPFVREIVEAIIKACHKFPINDYERSNLIFTFRAMAMFNEKGHKKNQKLILSLMQKNRDLKLIQNRPLSVLGIPKKSSIFDFDMSPTATYMSTMFQIFAVLVESKNLINIGKLSNIYTYSYLLNALRESSFWQMRWSIRSYINRLYYLVQDADVFIFEEFVRNEFAIIAQELVELVEIYTKPHDDIEIVNSIRFKYDGSHIYLQLLEILTSLDTVLQRPLFQAILFKELKKREKKNDMELHKHIVKIANNLGFILKNRYTTDAKNKMTGNYIKNVLQTLKRSMMEFSLGFLEDTCNNQVLEQESPEDVGDVDTNKKYVYDYGKTFFKNLYEMLVMVNAKKKKEKLIKEFQERKNNADASIEGRKLRFIEMIFSGKLVEGALKTAKMVGAQRAMERKEGKEKPSYNSSVLTSVSRHFSILARPKLSQDQENIVLNKRLKEVKTLLTFCPLYHKFCQDEFIRLVRTLTNIDQISKKYYSEYCFNRLNINLDVPLVSLDQMFKNMFKMCMDHPNEIEDRFKVPIIKLIRCYISEAMEKDQEYKLSVDSWDADYVSEDDSANQQLVNRQNRIDKCGGAQFIVEILKENLDSRTEVLNEVLLLGIVFLFGGNKDCQNSILQALKKDITNKMLVNLNNLMMKIGNFVYSMNKMKQTKGQRVKSFNYSVEDTFDFYNEREKVLEKKFGYETEDRMEAKVKTDNEKALCRSFRFLQLFCQNNNVEMKNFLHEQINEDGMKKAKTIDFISTTTILLRKFFKIMNRNMCKFKLSLLLDFINECTQIPCLQNQIALTKSSYFQDVCYMSSFFASRQNLQKRLFDVDNKDTMAPLYEIYDKSIQLILSNLQGNDDQIYQQFISKCQPRFLWQIVQRNLEIKLEQYKQRNDYSDMTLETFDAQHITEMLKYMESQQQTFDDEIVNILNIFVILKKVNNYAERQNAKAHEDRININKQALHKMLQAQGFRETFDNVGLSFYPHFKEFVNLFEPLLLQIEINCKSGMQYVYFPYNPVFKFLAKDTKNRIMFQVNRDTQRDKLVGILGYRDEIFKQVQWNYNKKYNNKLTILKKELPFELTSQLVVYLRKAALIVSIIIMAIMMSTVEVDHDTDQRTSEYSYGRFPLNIILKLLSLVQLGLSIAYLGVWIVLRYPLAIAKEEKQINEEHELESKRQGNKVPELPSRQEEGSGGRLAKVTQKLLKVYDWLKASKLGAKIADMCYVAKCFWNHEAQFGPILLFVAVSLAGNFIGMQYFTVHIFDIFLQISLLGNVFKAITTNAKTLSILSLLAGAFIFVFNVLSFATYTPVIYPDDQPEEVCQNLFDCVLTMYNSGAIGDQMDQLNLGRFTFDLIYVVFMELLFQNLVGGVIIDSFTQMRENDQAIEKDKSNMCFICGRDRAAIENNGENFNEHIKLHDLWNYLYYIYCLKAKDPTDYSGLQYEINDKIEGDDVGWFPIFESSGDDELQGKMTELETAIDELKTKTLESHGKTIDSLNNWTSIKQAQG